MQVNETELFPALMHTFEDPDAENGDAMESLFDRPQGESQADASMKQDVQVGHPRWLMSCRNVLLAILVVPNMAMCAQS